MKLAANLVLFLVGALVAVTTGCGDPTPFPMQVVSGQVTYEDGSLIPAETIRIRFEPLTPPLDPKTHPRSGRSLVDVSTGEFNEVTTYTYGDGLVVGKHKVLLSAKAPGSGDTSEPLIPPEYSDFDTTPLEVDVADTPFDLRIRKP